MPKEANSTVKRGRGRPPKSASSVVAKPSVAKATRGASSDRVAALRADLAKCKAEIKALKADAKANKRFQKLLTASAEDMKAVFKTSRGLLKKYEKEGIK